MNEKNDSFLNEFIEIEDNVVIVYIDGSEDDDWFDFQLHETAHRAYKKFRELKKKYEGGKEGGDSDE